MKLSDLNKWDRRFIDLATTVGGWSKGPRKRVGAVIVRPDRSVASMGYNGAPRGFDDERFLAMRREEQHKIVVHAEVNAIYQLSESDDELIDDGQIYTIYISPLHPCENCAVWLIENGIKRVVAYCGHTSNDWAESAKAAEKLFIAHNVDYTFVED